MGVSLVYKSTIRVTGSSSQRQTVLKGTRELIPLAVSAEGLGCGELTEIRTAVTADFLSIILNHNLDLNPNSANSS